MESTRNYTPTDADPKRPQHSTRNSEGRVTKKKNSRIHVHDSRIRHQGQEWNIDKNSWRAWCSSHLMFAAAIITGVITAVFLLISAAVNHDSTGISMLIKLGQQNHSDQATAMQSTSTILPTTSVEVLRADTAICYMHDEIVRARDVKKTENGKRRGKERATRRQTCGTRGESCQAYGKPNICCPTGMTCNPSAYSPSGIYCCGDGISCLDTRDTLPECADNTFQCDGFLGGDCCQLGSACSLEGCLIVLQAGSDSLSSLSEKDDVLSTPDTAVGIPATRSTEASTAMTAEIGEIAHSVGPSGIRSGFGFSSSPVLEELALVIAVAIAWTAAWGYL
ncbi:hypothetical protein HD806DRAFT_531120 [Xylariaceae sp. AK1471]|nr:hypothetical protein HD806DRAFT_531120 [Xylariaceae sp. AK1471]